MLRNGLDGAPACDDRMAMIAYQGRQLDPVVWMISSTALTRIQRQQLLFSKEAV